MRAAALWVLCVAGCSNEAVLDLTIVTPGPGLSGHPYDGAEAVSMAIAESGEPDDLRVAEFPVGERIRLPSVPFSEHLVVHMSVSAADIVSSYGRTCSFDFDSADSSPGTLHLYLARIGRWAAAEDPPGGARRDGFAYSMPDGGGAFIGGGAPLARIDVGGNRYREFIGTIDREGTAYAALIDGRAVVVGGLEGGEAVGSLALIDLRRQPGPDGPFTLVSAPPIAYAAVAPLADGNGIIVGGEHGGTVSDATYYIDLESSTGVEVRNLQSLNTPRAEPTTTRLGSDLGADVLITGGRDASGNAIAEAELYRPLARTFESLGAAVLNTPRWGHHAVALPDRSVLVVGGYTGAGTTPSIELFDTSLVRFISDLEALPPQAGRVRSTATTLPDGRILIAGGLDANGEPTDAVIIVRLDPESGTLSVLEADSMSRPRAGHAAVLLCDGTVLITGGDDGLVGSERYNPPAAGRR